MARNEPDRAIRRVRGTARPAEAAALVHAGIADLTSRALDRSTARRRLIDLPVVSFEGLLCPRHIKLLSNLVKIKITTTSDKRIVKDKTYNADLILNNRTLATREDGKVVLA